MMNLLLLSAVGGIIGLAIGSLWYGKLLFGHAWMAETGITEEDAKASNPLVMFGIAFVITAYLTFRMKWIHHEDESLAPFVHGMFHGVMHVGVYAIGALIVNALFELKTIKYILINAGYWVTVFALIGGVIAIFPIK